MSVAIVTGSAGLVGSEAATHFANLGWDVIGIDNDMRARFFGEEASTRWVRDRLQRQLKNYLHRDIDIVIKHLNILRNAGVLDRKTSDQDARFLLYFIPQQWRLRAGVLDFGCCILNLPPS